MKALSKFPLPPLGLSIPLLLLVGLFSCGPPLARGLVDYHKPPKSFFTNGMLVNKVYPMEPLKALGNIKELQPCHDECAWEPLCFSFAHSVFAKRCLLWSYQPGAAPAQDLSYTLYIKERTEEEGYFKSGPDNYIKLYLQYVTAFEADKVCRSNRNGMLASVMNEERNNLMWSLMDNRKVFYAHIGVTDEIQEGDWRYYNGLKATYTNWNIKGFWQRRDRNCAMIMADRTWRQLDCRDRLPFFCQIPYF